MRSAIFSFCAAAIVGAIALISCSGSFVAVVRADTANSSSVIYLNVGSSTPAVPPSIFLIGPNPMNLVAGDTFVDPGATATDTENENLTGSIVVTGGPVNTAVVGTTTLVYTVTDPHNSLSSSVSRVVIVNPASNVIPSQPPAQIPSTNGPGGQLSLYSFNLAALVGTSTVSITWFTNMPALSTLAWGTDPDATRGFVSEVVASTTHAISLDRLTPDTTYYVIVHEYAPVLGMTSTFSYSFTTLPLVQMTYPSNVSDLTARTAPTTGTAQGSAPGILVAWTNPTGTDISTIIVTRGTRFFPRDPAEGYLVSDAYETSSIDTDIVPGTNYFYTVFVKDKHGNYSSGTAVEYFPENSGTHPSTGFATSSASVPVNASTSTTQTSQIPPLFGGVATEMSSTTLGKIIFVQKGIIIVPQDGHVAIDRGFAVTISIPPAFIPKDTEEAVIKILGSTFIFEKLKNGWLQAIVPASFDYQSVTPFNIAFLFVGSETDLEGSFVLPNQGTGGAGNDDQVFQNFFPYYFILTIIIVLILAALRRRSKAK